MSKEKVGNLIKGLFESNDNNNDDEMWEKVERDFAKAITKMSNKMMAVVGFEVNLKTEKDAIELKEKMDKYGVQLEQWNVTEDFPFNTVNLLKQNGELIAMYTTFVDNFNLLVSDITYYNKEV